MKHLIPAAAVFLAFIITAGTVPAQQGPPMGMAGGLYEDEDPGAVPEAKREEVRKKVEALRMWKLTEALKLDEKTSTKLASFLSAIEEQRRAALKNQATDMHDLSALLKKGSPATGDLKARIDRIEKNQAEMRNLRERELKGIKDLLTVEQQARYLVFQQEFRREIRQMITGARGGAGQGPGMRGGPGKGGPGAGQDRFRRPPE